MARLDRQLWEALRPLLNCALDLCATERAEYLDDLRTDSPRVVAALEELLQCESIAKPC